ncbi:hypothetical protein OAK38_06100 [Verrucomicrobia bacterium]|nr:hypothetical protein [Verrucomicrobiota bacterium]
MTFFNTNYRVADTSNAANLIAQGGAIQGQMFANLGKTIGSSIEKFRKNKEEKEREKASENQFIRMYDEDATNPIFQSFGITSREEAAEAAKAVSKDPALAKQAMAFAQARMQMENQEMARAQAERDEGRKGRQEAMLLDAYLNKAETDQLGKDFAQSMFAQPTRPFTQADVDAGVEIPPLDPDPFAPPPQMTEGPAPAVQALPERYRSYGQEIAKKVQLGEIDPRMGLQEIQRANKEAMANAIDPLQFAKFQQESVGFAQDQGFKTFTPEANSIQVGDETLPISGTVGSAKVAEELKNDIPNFNAMNGMFSRLMEIGGQESWWDDSTLKMEANALVKSIQGQMREEVLGPGTVTDSERAILDDIVANPFKKGDNIDAPEAINSLRSLQTQLSDKFKNKLTSFGLKVGSGSTAQPGTPSLTTSSGKKVELINLDNF